LLSGRDRKLIGINPTEELKNANLSVDCYMHADGTFLHNGLLRLLELAEIEGLEEEWRKDEDA